jgi:serine protease AprX
MKKGLWVLLVFWGLVCTAQEDAWVYFTDKPNANFYLNNPQILFSPRALERRANQNIALDFTDAPVEETYLEQVSALSGITVLAKSNWMNCAHVRGSFSAIQSVLSLPFVNRIQFANKNLNSTDRPHKTSKEFKISKWNAEQEFLQYGSASNQIQQLNGHLLHQEGFTGAGKIIAVLDNGFIGVNTTQPFARLFQNNQILGGYDFVDRDENVYDGGSHGTMVLSTIGAYRENELIGTAPNASFYLFKTEANAYENPLEESLWVEAAEMADRLGVDIISTSLGYSTFDNPNYNYTYQDMNGVTTFISRGADLAFSKGIFCVTSAGNSGSSSWQYITAPADAITTLTVGAVNAQGTYAPFSSIGPSFDGRVKPDVVAQGVFSTVVLASGQIGASNGTSFSAPIVSGLVACLWQALPDKTNTELLQIIRESGHLYSNPTSQLGYGIPNFYNAFQNNLSVESFHALDVSLYPNPFTDKVSFYSSNAIENGYIKIWNTTGQLVFKSTLFPSESLNLSELPKGLYLYELEQASSQFKGKLIKK